MKKSILLSLLSCLFTLALFAEEVKPAALADWIFEGRSLRYNDGIGSFTGYALYSRGFIPVDPAKKYVVSGVTKLSGKGNNYGNGACNDLAGRDLHFRSSTFSCSTGSVRNAYF